jgi:hypothetical protein
MRRAIYEWRQISPGVAVCVRGKDRGMQAPIVKFIRVIKYRRHLFCFSARWFDRSHPQERLAITIVL